MRLKLVRYEKGTYYTRGRLYVEKGLSDAGGVELEYLCDTLEDTDRGMSQDMTNAQLRLRKVYGQTAIPTGTYEVRMDQKSPLYVRKINENPKCNVAFTNGYMPRLMSVPCYEGVLIHPGNTVKDTLGCLLVGLRNNDKTLQLKKSGDTFRELYKRMQQSVLRREDIWIEIT